MRPILCAALVLSSACKHHAPPPPARGPGLSRPARAVHRATFQSKDRTLVIEVLDDDLVHLALIRGDRKTKETTRIPTTPMVARTDWPGPRLLERTGKHRIRTAEIELRVDPEDLAVTATYLSTQKRLTTLRLADEGLSIDRAGATDLYGLGQQLTGRASGSWLGRTRTPGNEHGNRMVPFKGGAVGNTQIPVLYALGEGSHSYALFVDQPEAQTWDFRGDPFQLELRSDRVRLYLMAGPDLPDLRRDYMELTGRAPVPPRAAFGLWISEYGYRGWEQVEEKLASLEKKGFPVDGVVLDLFWFGGIEKSSPESRMGSLRWDEKAFPAPKKKIAELRRRGVGVIVIEESYVSKGLPEYSKLADAGYLVRRCATCPPASLDSWWGMGGMIDWTNPAAADFWHGFRRAVLVEAGVVGHWTDLGEPEDFSSKGYYHGLRPGFDHRHAAVANLYNFAWLESIDRGYRRRRVERRPFMLSRSGAAGIQRFGAAMWSGDIGSNMTSLRAHIDAQTHVSLSGIDYYGSDVGGFHRRALDGDVDRLYTRWLACALMTDVPVRPHTMNLEHKHETAPDRVGHLPSNLANVKLRYRLRPYLYSLAHRAFRTGEAVFPPPVYHFQRDAEARRITRQKMIGPHLMAALVADHGAIITDVYLPPGAWFGYHEGERHRGGRWLRGLGLSEGTRYRLPLFARAGAVIPEQDPRHPKRLVVRVFPGERPTETTLYEDDGWTVAYREGAVRATRISQRLRGKQLTITLHPGRGTYRGAPAERDVELLVPGDVRQVSLNGHPVGMAPAGSFTSCLARRVKPDRETVVEFLLK